VAGDDQDDLDGDGQGDACESDVDGDGLDITAEAARDRDRRRRQPHEDENDAGSPPVGRILRESGCADRHNRYPQVHALQSDEEDVSTWRST
jgi:hypothetical protein